MDKLSSDVENLRQKKQSLEEEIEKERIGKEITVCICYLILIECKKDERKKNEEEYAKLTKELEELDAKLAKYAEFDPELHDKKSMNGYIRDF